MKFWFKRRTTTLKKLLFCLVLFGFSFVAIGNPVLALTPDQQEAFNQSLQQNPSTTTNSIKEGQTTNSSLNNYTSAQDDGGKVLGCGPGDLVGCLSEVKDVVLGIPAGVAKGIINFIFENLFDLVTKVILYAVRIIASIFGVSLGPKICDEYPPKEEKECVEALKALSEIDPLFAMDTSIFRQYNLFTIADGSIASVYSSFPKDATKTYLADTFNGSVLGAKPAYAQGVGTQLITQGPVQKAWQLISNLAYVGMVIILVVIGFMVMLRKRLDPRTVVSATNSLPKIGIALVLIVFSFAIAGLFFDLIYVMYNLVRDWASQLPNTTLFQAASGGINIPGIGRVEAGELFWVPFFTFLSDTIINPKFFVNFLASLFVGGLATGGATAAIATVILIGYFIFELIVRLSIFVIAVLLFWTVFMRYITMIVLTIFSPIFFLVGALPGFETATTNWFKRMFASALVFPIVLALVYLALSFVSLNTSSWVPAGLGTVLGAGAESLDAPPPVQGGGFFLKIPTLIGLGFILFALKIPGFIDELLGLKDPLGRGGLGVGLLFASAGIPAAGLKKVGDIGKTMGGLREVGETYAGYGKAQGKDYGTLPGAKAVANFARYLGSTKFGEPRKPGQAPPGGIISRTVQVSRRVAGVVGRTPFFTGVGPFRRRGAAGGPSAGGPGGGTGAGEGETTEFDVRKDED